MKKRYYTTELQDAIQLLEAERAINLQLMKNRFRQTSESLNPRKLLQNTLKEITTSPYIADNLLSAGVGLAVGYVSKKAIVGWSGNKLARLLGTVLQFGVANIIAQNPKTVRAVGHYISQRISHKEE